MRAPGDLSWDPRQSYLMLQILAINNAAANWTCLPNGANHYYKSMENLIFQGPQERTPLCTSPQDPPLHPLPDPGHPLRTHENALKTLLGRPDFGARDLKPRTAGAGATRSPARRRRSGTCRASRPHTPSTSPASAQRRRTSRAAAPPSSPGRSSRYDTPCHRYP